MLVLPPCIKKMLSDFKSEHAALIAGYFRMQKTSWRAMIDILSRYDAKVTSEVISAYQQNSANFSCDLVRSLYPDICDTRACPLINNFDPLSMAKNIVEKALYVSDTGEMIIYFRNSNERMTFEYAQAIRNTRAFASEFIAKTVIVLGTAIDIRPYKDPDTGERVDPAFEFLMWLGQTAEKVVSDDAYGIGVVIQNILQSEPIVTIAEARYNPDARVIVKENSGVRYLLIDQQYLRFRVKPLLGNQATPRKINSILASYGIRLTRATVGGDRRYFYAFSSEVLEKLTGKTINELIGVTDDWDEALSRLVSGDEND